jgi:hypothetical protein
MSNDLISRFYESLWSRLGGRPWTYIIRDSYHQRPLLWLALTTGIGVLLGPLFWGTPWIPGQTGS